MPFLQPMCSAGGCYGFAVTSFLIRKSPDQSLYTAPRGLSQCLTSFIGTWRQGIHRKPLVASPRDAENLLLFGLQIFNALDIWGYYLSVTIQLLRYNFTVWPVSDAIEIFKSIDHSSRLFCFRDNTTRHTPPGRNYDLTTCGAFLDFMSVCRSTNFFLLQ